MRYANEVIEQVALEARGLLDQSPGHHEYERALCELTARMIQAADEDGMDGPDALKLAEDLIYRKRWRVPLSDTGTFGQWVQHGLKDGLVQVMLRDNGGWLPHSRPCLPGQVYRKKVQEAVDNADNTVHEVVVVGMETGTWVTVWAVKDNDVTHQLAPEPAVPMEREGA